jgi:predicted nucleotidyltransferase/predicted XRE-type DNA-binding protein
MKSNDLHTKHVAKVLKTLRTQKQFSQKIVGNKLGKSQSFISNIERGKRSLGKEELENYLEILEIKKERYLSLLETLLFFDKIEIEAKENLQNKEQTQTQTQNKDKIEKTLLLQQLKNYFENQPIKKAYLFGSVARNQHTSESDIDLYLEFLDDYKLNIFYLSNMKNEITNLTGKEVDLVLKGTEHNFIKESLEREKILIYGK